MPSNKDILRFIYPIVHKSQRAVMGVIHEVLREGAAANPTVPVLLTGQNDTKLLFCLHSCGGVCANGDACWLDNGAKCIDGLPVDAATASVAWGLNENTRYARG